MSVKFPCGHPKKGNTQPTAAGGRCRSCNRESSRRGMRRLARRRKRNVPLERWGIDVGRAFQGMGGR